MADKSKRILRPKTVLKKVDMGNTWLWENVKNGTFPKPISLGARAVGFIEDEVDEWIASRIAASRSGV